jgi:di/tricarboxylate transporter
MTGQTWIMLAILVVMFALLVWDRFPAWLVFVGTLTACMTLKLATPDALLKGFSNTGVATVAALFPVAAGMYATGAISLLSQRLIGQPHTLLAAQLRILPAVAVGSAFLNNTPLVAMMIPVVRDLERTTGLPASKLLMGLSFAAIIGGTMTLIGTSVNLIIAGLTADALAANRLHGIGPLRIFDPFWVGLPATVAGLTFLILVGPHLLRRGPARGTGDGPRRLYRAEFEIEPGSALDGRTLLDAGFAKPVGFSLLSIHRGELQLDVAADIRLMAGDRLAVSAPADVIAGLWTTIGLVPAFGNRMSTRRDEHSVLEVVVAAGLPGVGRKVAELPLPGSPYEVRLIGVSHDGQAPAQPLGEYRVQAGDAGMIEVDDSFFYENRRESDFVLTRGMEGYEVKHVDRALIALVITAAMMMAAAFGAMSMLNAALLAGAAMLATGCLTVERIWRSLDWQTLVVLAAAVGLESAVTSSGLSKAIADLLAAVGGDSPRLALAVVFAGTVLMTNGITHAAAAAFMFPVAVSMADRLGVSFMPFAMILMIGASSAFINPAGFQTNLMVQGPGGYSFADFAKVGLPLTVVVAIVVLLVAPVAYGF